MTELLEVCALRRITKCLPDLVDDSVNHSVCILPSQCVVCTPPCSSKYQCAVIWQNTQSWKHTHTHMVRAGCPRFLMGSDWSPADIQTASVSQTWKSEGRRMEECQRENADLSCRQPRVSNL